MSVCCHTAFLRAIPPGTCAGMDGSSSREQSDQDDLTAPGAFSRRPAGLREPLRKSGSPAGRPSSSLQRMFSRPRRESPPQLACTAVQGFVMHWVYIRPWIARSVSALLDHSSVDSSVAADALCACSAASKARQTIGATGALIAGAALGTCSASVSKVEL